MRYATVILAAAVAAGVGGCHAGDQHQHAASTPPKPAVALLAPKSDSNVKGTASFSAKGGKVTMSLKVEGLTPGEHAVHIHDKGDCSAPDATSAGGHWNPMQQDHGMFGHDPYHKGDIGNLVAKADGKAEMTFTTDQWVIGGGGNTDILGHAVIVHATADDFKTQPTGNAGGRVACGVIRAGQ